MPDPQPALVKLSESQLSQLPKAGIVRIDGQLYQVQLRSRQAQPQSIHQEEIAPRPAQYQTAKSRGLSSPPVSLPKLPSVLALTLATVIALSFLVAASMFSISLTAYSNSVERIDRTRSFIRVE
jgi:hypothetical protein